MKTSTLSRRDLMKCGVALIAYPGLTLGGNHARAADRALVARAGIANITNGETGPTDIWGYDGQVPGPVLRVRQGDELAIRLLNQLEQPTSIHWHGIRIVNDMDGSPLVQEPVAPGAEFEYRFSLPDAGTYWYHTHTRGYEQLTRGLYGVLIVDENAPLQEDFDGELILAIDDWLLDRDGQIAADSIGSMMAMSHSGRTGNWASVNGVHRPSFDVRAGGRLRLRLVNTCNARILDLVFGDLDAWLIALDGQPVSPEPLERALVLAPGQRADVALDIPVEGEAPYLLGIEMDDSVYDTAYFAPTKQEALAPRKTPPKMLPENPLARAVLALDTATKVDLSMSGGAMGDMAEATLAGKTMDIRSLVQQGKVWAFNGMVDGDKQAPLFEVARGTTVSINIENQTAWPHAMHTHGHHFIHTHTDSAAREAQGPWRDTHLMEPGEHHTLSFVADNPGDWLLHCHMVEHSASGMTGWFRVRA